MAQSSRNSDQARRAAESGRYAVNQYRNTGQFEALDQGIVEFRRALSQFPERDPGTPPTLKDLADALYLRFERTGEQSALDEAISLSHEALAMLPAGWGGRVDHIANLARLLLAHSEASGDLASLQQAVTFGREAVSEGSHDTASRGWYQSLLGQALYTSFQRFGNSIDLDEAVELTGRSIADTPPGSPELRILHFNLASMLLARFRFSGQADDLERSVESGRAALELTPPGDRLLVPIALNLAEALLASARGQHDNRLAVSNLREALSVLERFPATQPDDAFRASRLRGDADSELAAALSAAESKVPGVASSSVSQTSDPVSSRSAPPAPTEGQPVPGFAADTVAGQDELGITGDVEGLCQLLTSSQVAPPLSVGLFGDWGSGKSFFMQRMRERIDWISTESRKSRDQGGSSDFCENVRQITFNAWHYVDANLWASLVARIFDGLLGEIDDQLEPLTPQQRADLERRRRRLLDSAELMAGDARRQRYLAEQRLAAKTHERNTSASKLDTLKALRAADLGAVARRDPAEVTDALDIVPESLQANIELLGQAHGIWRQAARAWARLGSPARWQIAVLSLVATALVAVGVAVAHDGAIRVVPLIAAAAALLEAGRHWLPEIRSVRRAADLAARTVDQAVRRQQDILNAEIDTATAAVEAARAQLAAADAEIAEIQSGHRIGDFVAARASSTDYRSSLGLIAVIRRDLGRLSRLVSQPASDLDQAIDRVVLYIDDLDRCPAQRVAEVLQAVHLLLAFPLFIVVVGADARWLLRSLELHYAELISSDRETGIEQDPELALHWSATPQNYLDKIFQIPFSLRPMGRTGFDRLIRGTAGPSTAPPTASAITRTVPVTSDGVGVGSPLAGKATTAGTAVSLAGLPQAEPVSRGRLSADIAAAAFVGPGHRLALVSGRDPDATSVTIMDARTGQQRRTWTADGIRALSPDGSLAAALSDREIRLHEADSGRVIKTLPGLFSALHFSPDGTWLVAVRSGGFSVFDPTGQHRWDRELPLPPDLRWLGVLPGESQAIQVTSNAAVRIGLGTAGQPTPFEGGAVAFACSPDGRVLVTAGPDALRIFDTATAGLRQLLPLTGVTALAVSPDATMIAAAFQEPGGGPGAPPAASSSIVIIETATGRPVMRGSVDTPVLDRLAYSASGDSLAVVGDSVQVQTLTLTRPAATLTAQRLQLTEPELGFLAQLWPLVRTPRAAKRLVNVYQLLRAPLSAGELAALLGTDGGSAQFPAALLLLTIVTGFPDLAQKVVGELLQAPGTSWPDFIGANRSAPDKPSKDAEHLLWKIFFERYDKIDPAVVPQQIEGYVHWAPLVARYSFRTGRLIT